MKKIITLSILLLTAITAFAQHRYEMRSGIATTATCTNGQMTYATQYFDDYGALDCLQQHMEIPGFVSYDYYTITKGDTCWMVVEGGGTKKFKNPTPDLNFLNLTPEVCAKYKIQDLGEDTFLGKLCHKYSYEVKQNRKKGLWTVWIYKGFILKAHCSLGHLESDIEVIELRENVPVPAEVFNVD